MNKEILMGNKLDGDVAIVTGGNSGIGEATAHLFAKEGAKVAILARREKEGKEVESAIKASGGEATFFPVSYTPLTLPTKRIV